MVPLEPQKKVLVAIDFLNSDHGVIACETCHGGNADAQDKGLAHEGLVPIPSLSDPEGTCGECYEVIAASAKKSLHATLGPVATILMNRADQDNYKTIDMGCYNKTYSRCLTMQPFQFSPPVAFEWSEKTLPPEKDTLRITGFRRT